MKNSLIFFALGVLLLSCSSLGKKTEAEISAVGVDDLAKMSFGSLSADDLRAKFGEPHQIIKVPEGAEEAWIYFGKNDELPSFQRMSFTVNRATQMVGGGLWIPLPSEEMHHLSNALAHFPKAQFKIEDEGLIAHHSFSDNTNYTDTNLGVSIGARKSRNSVFSVAFGPSITRSLSSAK